MAGLRNRFAEADRYVWLYHYSCMVCNMNQQDVLHHIVSPSSHLYKDGDHNTSIFNSCPIHNQKCHIGNEAFLYRDDTIKMLLNKVARALLFQLDYVPNAKDILFVKTYQSLYENDIIKALKL